ncbi:hypothetical protein B0A52_04849 [Exophiala mesophila]|uniref:Uncharacterized protein n=1 Tax=Exophiala mesophila TaxID=212818 RepID=A0A438N6L2_EXOME|nr:hypothetical protein B0A52_04849 [Exophiala mesophila]
MPIKYKTVLFPPPIWTDIKTHSHSQTFTNDHKLFFPTVFARLTQTLNTYSLHPTMPYTLMMVLSSILLTNILLLGTMVQPTVADDDWLQGPSSTWTTVTIPATLVSLKATNSIHGSHPAAKRTSEPSSSPSFGTPVHTPAALATASPPEDSLTDTPDGEFMKHVVLPMVNPILPPGVPAAFLDKFYETARRHREQTSHFNPSRQPIPHLEQASASEQAKAEYEANEKRFQEH